MKRKIQHDAVNNQEDEDSSTCPICFPGDESFDKKEDKSIENSTAQPPSGNTLQYLRFTIDV